MNSGKRTVSFRTTLTILFVTIKTLHLKNIEIPCTFFCNLIFESFLTAVSIDYYLFDGSIDH